MPPVVPAQRTRVPYVNTLTAVKGRKCPTECQMPQTQTAVHRTQHSSKQLPTNVQKQQQVPRLPEANKIGHSLFFQPTEGEKQEIKRQVTIRSNKRPSTGQMSQTEKPNVNSDTHREANKSVSLKKSSADFVNSNVLVPGGRRSPS